MPTALITWIAVISTAAFVALWFRVVHGELTRRRNMVESAKIQVLACRKKCVQGSGSDAENAAARAVLLRSEDIYRQSVGALRQGAEKALELHSGMAHGLSPKQRVRESRKAEYT